LRQGLSWVKFLPGRDDEGPVYVDLKEAGAGPSQTLAPDLVGTAPTGGACHRLRAVRHFCSSKGKTTGGGRRAKIYSNADAMASGKNTSARTQYCPHAILPRNHHRKRDSGAGADSNARTCSATRLHGHAHTQACTATRPHAATFLHPYTHTHSCTTTQPHGYADPHARSVADGWPSTHSRYCHHRGRRERDHGKH
jgi:hypothetical protein